MDNKHLQPAESEESELRIVLLGKTGVGKSASGNSILGSNEFKSEASPSSVTKKCEKNTREFDGQTLSVVDTPGLFHTVRNHEEVIKQIQDCILWLSPGPHVFLLVLKLNAFSRQDKEVLEAFQKVFPHAASHTIVLFTCADEDQTNDEDQINSFIKSHKDLQKFIESCEAYHVLNNQVKDESQVTDLLQKINNIKKERSHYSNEVFQQAQVALEQIEKKSSEIKKKKASVSEMLNAIGQNPVASMIAGVTGLEEAWKYLDGYREFVKRWVYERMPPEAKT